MTVPAAPNSPSTPPAPEVASPPLLPPPPEPTTVWVDQPEMVISLAANWRSQRTLALDTEFVRERTFYSKLGLVQISDGATAWLCDPQPRLTRDALGPALAATAVTWVAHSASEDLEVLARALGFVPRPLFDTQIAAALSGRGAALSLQKLIGLELGLELPKGETRTDWLRRPLSPAQHVYAGLDVVYLPELERRLAADLERLGRTSWLTEECERLLAAATAPDVLADGWLRVKGAGRFSPRQLEALRRLATWREEQARQRDLPRSFVLRDETLIQLAARQTRTAAEIARLPDLDRRQAARDGTTWLDLIGEAVSAPAETLPRPRPHLPPASREVEEEMRKLVRAEAERLAVPPEILGPRRLLVEVMHQAYFHSEPKLPTELAGWRRPLVGERLLELALGRARPGAAPRSDAVGLNVQLELPS